MDKRKEELKDLYSNLKEAEKEGINPPHYDIQSEDIDFRELICKFGEVTNQDSPDGIIPLGNAVYMVEHFQTSAYADNLLQKLVNQNYDRAKAGIKEGSCKKETPLHLDVIEWRNKFSKDLEKHMGHYDDYIENTHKDYPGKPYKFILVVEDVSELGIGENKYTILEIEEFAQEILRYPQIDGVIVCANSPRGYQVVAKERAGIERGVKISIDNCIGTPNEIWMYMDRIETELSPGKKKKLIKKCFRLLRKEDLSMNDSVFVEKKS